MKILDIDNKPIHRIQFLNAAKRGGVESQILSIVKARVDSLPNELEAILVTGDLQGVVQVWQLGKNQLLGESLASEYSALSEKGLVPPPENTGVILAGDLYSEPDGAKRGASGDVRPVWEAFAEHFRWVVGVQGNHDTFGTVQEKQTLKSHPKITLFDYESATLDGIVIGGISGVIGDPVKPARVSEEDFLSALQLVLEKQPELLVLHQGPNGDESQRGNQDIRKTIMKNPAPLTICGHVHWHEPLSQIGESAQVLNVDSRAFVLAV